MKKFFFVFVFCFLGSQLRSIPPITSHPIIGKINGIIALPKPQEIIDNESDPVYKFIMLISPLIAVPSISGYYFSTVLPDPVISHVLNQIFYLTKQLNGRVAFEPTKIDVSGRNVDEENNQVTEFFITDDKTCDNKLIEELTDELGREKERDYYRYSMRRIAHLQVINTYAQEGEQPAYQFIWHSLETTVQDRATNKYYGFFQNLLDENSID